MNRVSGLENFGKSMQYSHCIQTWWKVGDFFAAQTVPQQADTQGYSYHDSNRYGYICCDSYLS